MNTTTQEHSNSDFEQFKKNQEKAEGMLDKASILSNSAKNLLSRLAYSMDGSEISPQSIKNLTHIGLRLLKEIKRTLVTAQGLTDVDLADVIKTTNGIAVLILEASRLDTSNLVTCEAFWAAMEVTALLTEDLEQAAEDICVSISLIYEAQSDVLKQAEAANDPKVNAA